MQQASQFEAVKLSRRARRLPQQTIPAHARLAKPEWFGVHRTGPKAFVRIEGEIGLSGRSAGELLAAVGAAAEISVFINSTGGDTGAAREIHEGLAGRDVRVEIVGNCFSAAAIVALAGSRIQMHRAACLMVHKAQLFVFGSAEDLECGARRVRKLNAWLHNLLAVRTEQAPAVVRGWLAKDTFFDPASALLVGLVDEIVEDVGPGLGAALPAPGLLEPGLTDDEKLFHSFLAALGRITVRDKPAFLRAVAAWITYCATGAPVG